MTTLTGGQSSEITQTIRDNYTRCLNHAATAAGHGIISENDILSLAEFAITQRYQAAGNDESAVHSARGTDPEN